MGDANLQSEIIATTTLTDAGNYTDILDTHDGLLSGLSTSDNELDWREAFAKFAALVEADEKDRLRKNPKDDPER